MLTEETKKRVYFGILIGAAVLGAIFVVFAVFINRGTLTVVARAPYVLTISQLKTVACPADTCSSVVAPGDYTVTLKKQGYKDVNLQVSVPIGGEHKEAVVFEFVPFITELGPASQPQIFAGPRLDDSEKTKLPATELFFDDNHVVYLARHPQSHRQTLYVRTIEGSKLGPEVVATSFIRDLKAYLLIPDLDGQNKIAVIDNSDEQSALYIVDLQYKTRNKLLTYPVIKDLKWLPDSADFLLEARDNGNGSLAESIFLYRAQNQEATKLDLQTPLKNIGIIDQDHLIAATMQFIGETDNLSALEGSLVVLGEAEATPAVGAEPSRSALKFVDYSLVSLQGRLIKSEADLALPQEVKLADDKKSLYFLLGQKAYELRFSD